MQPPEHALALGSSPIEPVEGEVVRTIPVWAKPPDVEILAMLGGAPPDVPAALRIIRHRLELRRAEGMMWTIGVTSARDGEGKSTVAAQLALVLGEARRARVLLVEAAARPALSRILGVRVPSGFGFSWQIARRMQGYVEPWSVLAVGPSLHALVENEAEPGFSGALHAPAFREAIEQLGRAYDWVVVDGPSVLGSGDANVIEEAVDGMIVVVRSRASRGADVRAAMKQLGVRKAVGAVLWGARGAGEAEA